MFKCLIVSDVEVILMSFSTGCAKTCATLLIINFFWGHIQNFFSLLLSVAVGRTLKNSNWGTSYLATFSNRAKNKITSYYEVIGTSGFGSPDFGLDSLIVANNDGKKLTKLELWA